MVIDEGVRDVSDNRTLMGELEREAQAAQQ